VEVLRILLVELHNPELVEVPRILLVEVVYNLVEVGMVVGMT
jgi:hypothetical protein